MHAITETLKHKCQKDSNKGIRSASGFNWYTKSQGNNKQNPSFMALLKAPYTLRIDPVMSPPDTRQRI